MAADSSFQKKKIKNPGLQVRPSVHSFVHISLFNFRMSMIDTLRIHKFEIELVVYN